LSRLKDPPFTLWSRKRESGLITPSASNSTKLGEALDEARTRTFIQLGKDQLFALINSAQFDHELFGRANLWHEAHENMLHPGHPHKTPVPVALRPATGPLLSSGGELQGLPSGWPPGYAGEARNAPVSVTPRPADARLPRPFAPQPMGWPPGYVHPAGSRGSLPMGTTDGAHGGGTQPAMGALLHAARGKAASEPIAHDASMHRL